MAETPPEVICERRGACGTILLNRPQALNALTHGMVRAIAAALDAWEADPRIACVAVASAGGRAFCAGGDIRLLYQQGLAGQTKAQLAFWADEYRLNLRIRNYPKPYVAFIDGIVMGGGVGISLHGSHVVASENFSFAMPEVGIGFFPDVGATWLLPRLPGRHGARLALTGARAGAEEALGLGLARFLAPSAAFPGLLEALEAGGEPDAVLAPFAARRAAPDDGCGDSFSAPGVLAILARLDALEAPGAKAAAAAIRLKSPTSLCIALRQMQVGPQLSFEAAMEMEYSIVSRVCRRGDLYEGIRALAIDKDNKPQWAPARLEDVDSEAVENYFAPAADGGLFGRRP